MAANPAGEAPAEITDLARERQQARVDRDFAAADALRDRIADAGWVVTDTPDGFALAPRPPFDVRASLADLLVHGATVPSARVGVGLIVDGWPDDARTCIEALLAHTDAVVLALDCGNVDGAGLVVHELASANPDRVVELHVAQPLDAIGWAKATTALIELDPSPAHAVMDMSTVLTGDALTPLRLALDEPGVVGAGWQGADVDIADEWRSVVAAGPGEVDVLLGYLMAVDREAALATPPNPKARFYRNADLEWSLMLRASGGRLVVPAVELPARQDRHHGYHDSDPELRDRESKKTYDRILQAFRRRPEILRPREGSVS